MRAGVVVLAWVMLTLGGGAPATAAGPGVATMSVGRYHACAVRTDGTVSCWGHDGYGQLGDGTTGDADHLRALPVRVRRGSSAFRGVAKVAAGDFHTCAVRRDGSAWCWGDGSYGQLGDGDSGTGHRRTKPVEVRRGSGHLTGVEQISAGAAHACALRTDGSVWCWGDDEVGQLGDGTTGSATGHVRTRAVRVSRGSGYLDGIVAIAAGDFHTCAVRRDGSAWCWGDGSYGQLGDAAWGAGHHRTKAVRVRRGSGYLAKGSGIAAGGAHTCIRRTDGSAWCWGYDGSGQLGDGTTGGPASHVRTKAVQVLRGSGVLTGVTGIGAGVAHTCARRSDGSAFCWGYAQQGQLGDGKTGDPTTHDRLKPVRVVRPGGPFTGVRKLDGGVYSTCALRTDRTVWCWGGNDTGQSGRGSHDDDPHPYPRKVAFP